MKKVIVCQSRYSDRTELREYFQHNGYEAYLVNNCMEIASIADTLRFDKIYLEIKTLSDVSGIKIINSLGYSEELVLIISEDMQSIIGTLKNGRYSTIRDITGIKKVSTQ